MIEPQKIRKGRSSYQALSKTLVEALKPENIRKAEAIVKAHRDAGADDDQVVKALRVAFLPTVEKKEE